MTRNFVLTAALVFAMSMPGVAEESGSVLGGATFPPTGAENVPTNARLLLFPELWPFFWEDAAVAIVRNETGDELGTLPLSFDFDTRVYIIDLNGLLVPNALHRVEFVTNPDWVPGNGQQAPEGGNWRDDVVFTTGNDEDNSPPVEGWVGVSLRTNAEACFGDVESCGPWDPLYGVVLAHYDPNFFSDSSGLLAYRLWGPEVPHDFAVGDAVMESGVGGYCCEDGCADGLVCCAETPALGAVELEVFDAAGNTIWFEVDPPPLEELSGYENIGFLEPEPVPEPVVEPEPTAQPEPSEPEPEPVAKEFVPPDDIEDGCSSTPVAALPLWASLLLLRTRRRR